MNDFAPQKVVPIILNLFFTEELTKALTRGKTQIKEKELQKSITALTDQLDRKIPITKNLKIVEDFLKKEQGEKKPEDKMTLSFLSNIYFILNGYIEVNNLFFNLIEKQMNNVKNYQDLTRLVIQTRYKKINQHFQTNRNTTDYENLIVKRIKKILIKDCKLSDAANVEYELDNLMKNHFHVMALRRKKEEEEITKELWVFLKTTPIYHQIFAYFLNKKPDAKPAPKKDKKVLTKEPPKKGKPKSVTRVS